VFAAFRAARFSRVIGPELETAGFAAVVVGLAVVVADAPAGIPPIAIFFTLPPFACPIFSRPIFVGVRAGAEAVELACAAFAAAPCCNLSLFAMALALLAEGPIIAGVRGLRVLFRLLATLDGRDVPPKAIFFTLPPFA
jgi:hypothetical protein